MNILENQRKPTTHSTRGSGGRDTTMTIPWGGLAERPWLISAPPHLPYRPASSTLLAPSQPYAHPQNLAGATNQDGFNLSAHALAQAHQANATAFEPYGLGWGDTGLARGVFPPRGWKVMSPRCSFLRSLSVSPPPPAAFRSVATHADRSSAFALDRPQTRRAAGVAPQPVLGDDAAARGAARL